MKRQYGLILPALLVAALMAVAAGSGLFWDRGGEAYFHKTLHEETLPIYGRGLYAHETPFAAGGALGTDLAALAVFVPLLAVAIVSRRRGSLRGGLLLAGVLGASLYYAAFRALDTAYNALFPVYIALFSASFYAFVTSMATVDLAAFPAHFTGRFPRRSLAIFMFIAGAGTAFVWLSDLLPALAAGRAPAGLGTHTTVVTYAVDLGIIVPATLLSGILLLRRDGRGYLWSSVLAVMLALVGVMVIGQTIMQLRVGVEFTPGVLIGMVGSWVVMGAAAVWLVAIVFRSVAAVRSGDGGPSGTNGSRPPGEVDDHQVAELTATWNLLNPP
jgi:hypothetical protein